MFLYLRYRYREATTIFFQEVSGAQISLVKAAASSGASLGRRFCSVNTHTRREPLGMWTSWLLRGDDPFDDAANYFINIPHISVISHT